MSQTITIERGVMVPMRDGVKLAADIYRPDGNEKHPVLIATFMASRNNANLIGGMLFNPLLMVENGYVCIIFEARGREKSEGKWTPWVDDINDGYDRVEWAAVQPWSDGNVGVYGNCHAEYPALATAVANPPHLKAGVAYMGASNPHRGFMYTGGAFELSFNLGFSLMMTVQPQGQDIDPANLKEFWGKLAKLRAQDPIGHARYLPLADLVSTDKGTAAPWWQLCLNHPAYDEYWKSVDLIPRVNEIKVPILHIAGWYDQMLYCHMDLNEAFKKHGDPQVKDKHRLIIGPWDHDAYYNQHPTFAGERDFGVPTGPALVYPAASQWFDHWLKGKETPFMPTNGVRYFNMGTKEWKEAPTWPPAHTKVNYYLHSGGRANTRFGDGTLFTEAPNNEPADSYVYDPFNPVPTMGGRTLLTVWHGGVMNQAGVEEREDVLCYTSPRLNTPVSISGPLSVTLHASSSAPDTDFTAKLVDVEPEGYCANIAEGIIRARYRNGEDHEEFLVPGEIAKFEIDLCDVSHTFKAGHRIRLEISSSNFPHFDRNLNSKVTPALGTVHDAQKAVQQVYHRGEYASYLTLPVVLD